MSDNNSRKSWITLAPSGIRCYYHEELGQANADKFDVTNELIAKCWEKRIKAEWDMCEYRMEHLPGKVVGLIVRKSSHTTHKDPREHTTVSLMFDGTRKDDDEHAVTFHLYPACPPPGFMPAVPATAASNPVAYAVAEGVAQLHGPKKDWATPLMGVKDGHTKMMASQARLGTEVRGFRGKRRNFLTDPRLLSTEPVETGNETLELWIRGNYDTQQRRWRVESLHRRDDGREVPMSDVKRVGERVSFMSPALVYDGPGTGGKPMKVVLSVFPGDEDGDNTYPEMAE